jgi:hypothetical protein
VLTATDLAAPHLMPVEVASILRRAALAGDISHDIAALAHGDLLDLRVALHPSWGAAGPLDVQSM